VIVVPELPNGALQTRITVPDQALYPVPDVDPVTAAVLHIAYQTAHVALHRRAALQAGETVLVHGGAGGVGSAAIQLARAAGARVIATATGAAKTSRLDADVALDLTTTEDLAAAVGHATDGRGADVILDVVGGDLFDRSRRCVAFGGRIVIAGFAGGTIPQIPANHVLLRNYSVVGVHLAAYRREEPALLRAVHEELLALLANGRIAPRVHAALPFERAPEGLRLLAERQVIGRVALTTAPPA
jgi:NADPH2:quinone reductase